MNLRQHIKPLSNAISIKPADDDRGQCSSSNISATDQEESWDQSPNLKFQETIPSRGFESRYHNLSLELKQCLLCFSAFPANSKIRKKALTYLWIGEGFIDPTIADCLSYEEIAAKYFAELITKGFIDPVDEKDSGDFSSCKMKPSIHPFVVWFAKFPKFFDFDDRVKATTNFITSQRACLSGTQDGCLERLVERVNDSNGDKLYTLFNLDETFLEFLAGWFSKVKNLTTVSLGCWRSSNRISLLVEDEKFLEDLRHLKLLRCLSLNRIYKIKKLPASICQLLNLRILDLKACYDLQELPDAIGSLQNLTHLDMSDCHLIDHMPTGLCKLVKLLVLKGFVISGDHPTCQDQCTLADLVALKKLKKLSIYTNISVTGNEGQLNSLSQFNALQVLTISWTRAPPSRALLCKLVSLRSIKSQRHENVEVMTTPNILPTSLLKLDLRCWP